MNLLNEEDIRIEKTEDGKEQYIFDPYNSLNKEITKAEVEGILKTYGIDCPVINFNLYRRAFVHRSYIRRPKIENEENNIVILPKPADCLPLYTKSNERLEFVGDGILECVTKFCLYRRFPKENEGFMTEKKIALVKNEAIGRLAFEMGLHRWFILSKHAEIKNTRTNLKKLGCLFESFLGAMFLDFNHIENSFATSSSANGTSLPVAPSVLSSVAPSVISSVAPSVLSSVAPSVLSSVAPSVLGLGFQYVQIFIERVFEKHVNWMELIQNDDNYKNILQVRIQKEFKVTPHYMEIEEHSLESGYYMGVYLCLGQPVFGLTHQHSVPYDTAGGFDGIHQYMSMHGKIFIFLGSGKHKIKKKAEQIACEESIRKLPL